MNKSLTTFDQQAKAYAGRAFKTGTNAYNDAYTQKFAELIIMECASISQSSEAERCDISDNTPVSRQIKDHFGFYDV